jgi:RimJ/RimL family protein N-acetyltransferase
MLFETNRLYVRKLEYSDFHAFHEMQSDHEVMRYTPEEALDEAENQRQLKMCIDCYSKIGNDFWVWAIVRKSDKQFVGTCAVTPNAQRPEIGYRFLRKFFGLGYGQEVCDGLIHYGIHDLKLTEIVAYVDIRNVASKKILERSALKFVEETTDENGVVDRFYRWSAGPCTHASTG